jgi:hypothetical protein
MNEVVHPDKHEIESQLKLAIIGLTTAKINNSSYKKQLQNSR